MGAVKLLYDVIVVGGGTAGSVAAISALESGLTVAIIEKNLSLGGTMTNGLVTPMMPTSVNHLAIHKQLTKELDQMGENLHPPDGSKSIFFDPEVMKVQLEQKIIALGGEIVYETQIIDAELEQNAIKKIELFSLGEKYSLQAKTYIDASGDAVLARLLSLPVMKGEEKSGVNQATSFRFEVGNVAIETLRNWCKSLKYTFNDCESDAFFEFVHVPELASCGGLLTVFAEAVERGELLEQDIRYIQAFSMPMKKGVLAFNGPQLPNHLTTTTPENISLYVIEGRKMQRRLLTYLKKNIPGFEEAYLGKEANQLGVRESFRIVGQYVLTEADYLARRKFEDGVVRGDWYVDVHGDDLAVEKETFKVKYQPGEYYEIPYRCLVTERISNYIAVGRHISTSFKMQSSARIQVTCREMGEVAGKACAKSIKTGVPLNQLSMNKVTE